MNSEKVFMDKLVDGTVFLDEYVFSHVKKRRELKGL